MTYKLTDAGRAHLDTIYEAMNLPNPTGSFEFGGAYAPNDEDSLLQAISDNGGKATNKWLLNHMYYNIDNLLSLVRKGYLERKR